MNHLTLMANQRPETLERILRVIRHRGFTVLNLTAEQNGETLSLKFSVESQRDISLLINQLTKLEDVTHIEKIG